MKKVLLLTNLLVCFSFACSKQSKPVGTAPAVVVVTDPIVEALSTMKCVELQFDKEHALSKVHIDRQEMHIDSIAKTPTETRCVMSCKNAKDGFTIEGVFFSKESAGPIGLLEQHWEDQQKKDIIGDPGPVSAEQRKLWELEQQQKNARALCDVYLRKMKDGTIAAKKIPLEITSISCVK